MKESEKELYKIIAEAGIDTAMGIFNVLTFGVAMNLTDFIDKIIKHREGVRDMHYTLQVKSFLTTPTQLTEKEFHEFMANNPSNQRLGLEVFKILEQTVIEEQAEMLARAFSLHVKGGISDSEMHKYIYIIKRIDKHLMEEIDHISHYKLNPRSYSYNPSHPEYQRRLAQEIAQGYKPSFKPMAYTDDSEFIKNVNPELVNFGFVKRRANIVIIDGSQLYEPTEFFINFKKDILNK